MSERFNYYDKAEEKINKNSINEFQYLFESYLNKKLCLNLALEKMFESQTVTKKYSLKELVDDIILRSSQIIEKNWDEIHKEYPNITKEEATIISSYTC